MDLKDLTDYCQAVAIANKFAPTEDYVWRRICRAYSEKFHTPLHIVEELNPEYVVLHVYEGRLDDVDEEENLEKLLDVIYSIEDPEYERQKEDELSEFIQDIEQEEQERISKGKPIHPAMKKEPSLVPEVPKKEQPKEGFLNLSYLEDSENER